MGLRVFARDGRYTAHPEEETLKPTHDPASMREQYGRDTLLESSLPDEPLTLFTQWFDHAVGAGQPEPNACSVATVSPDGWPESRMVLLKGYDTKGFRFFTNYQSDKGRALEVTPRAELCFWWHVLERQVRIQGDVVRVPSQESDAYFRARPRESQLGAWASEQSRRIAKREALQEAFSDHAKRYAGKDVARPGNWGGYRVAPSRLEFWQGQPSRLHDRIRYDRANSDWDRTRLAP